MASRGLDEVVEAGRTCRDRNAAGRPSGVGCPDRTALADEDSGVDWNVIAHARRPAVPSSAAWSRLGTARRGAVTARGLRRWLLSPPRRHEIPGGPT
jgi:hypothetical protein